ncbi:MAG: BamA/TamA family outer membrane protein [Bacteroidota bacterium]
MRIHLTHVSLVCLLIVSTSGAFPQETNEETNDDATVPTWREEFMRLFEPPRDYGHDWRLGSLFGLTPEDGLLLGAGPILYEFGFRKFPYTYRMQLVGGITIATGRVKFVYTLGMPRLSRTLSLDLYTHFSQLEVRNFYGFGNSTTRNPAAEENDFYRVPSQEFWLQPTLYHSLFKRSNIGVGLWFKHFTVRGTETRKYQEVGQDTLDDNRANVGIGLQFRVDTREHSLFPSSGAYLYLSGFNHFYVFSEKDPFQKITGDLRLYLGGTLFTDIQLALRVGGEKIFGEPPVYEAASLGGGRSLRGYFSQRFTGDASLFGSADLRLSLGRYFIIIPTEIGLILLADAGRVWLNGDSDGNWHTDAGLGLWFAPLSRDFLLSVIAAQSVEGLFINAGAGFSF